MANQTVAATTMRVVIDERGTPGEAGSPYFIIGGVATLGDQSSKALDAAFGEWRMRRKVPNKATRWNGRLFADFAYLLLDHGALPFSMVFENAPENIAVVERHVSRLVDARIALGFPPKGDQITTVHNYLWTSFVGTAFAVNLYSLSVRFHRVRAVRCLVGRRSLKDWEAEIFSRELGELTGSAIRDRVLATFSRLGDEQDVVLHRGRLRRCIAWDAPAVELGSSQKVVAIADAYTALIGRKLEGDREASDALELLERNLSEKPSRGSSPPSFLLDDRTESFLEMARKGWMGGGGLSRRI